MYNQLKKPNSSGNLIASRSSGNATQRSSLQDNRLQYSAPGINADGALMQRVTEFEKPSEDHSSTEAGVFGIGPAGWVFLEQSHQGKQIYGWDRKPITDDENIYSVQTFFEHGWKTLSLDHKAKLLSDWGTVMGVDFNVQKTKAVREQLQQEVKVSTILEAEFGGGEDGLQYFAAWAKDEGIANDALKTSANKIKAIKDDPQKEAYFQSKQGLVAILQENVTRFYQGKPLIPTYLVIRKQGADPASHFVPNLKDTRDKSTTYTTDKEIRMIYKLTQEAPDEKLRDIARKTFFIQQQDATDENNRTFETIPSPWEEMDNDYTTRSTTATDNYAPGAHREWKKRTRKGGKNAYDERSQKDVPTWITELVDYHKSQEQREIVLSDQSESKATYSLTKDPLNLIITKTYRLQMGGTTVRTVKFPFKQLLTANIELDNEDDHVEVTLTVGDLSYNMSLSTEEASQFKRLVNRALNENSRLIVGDDADLKGTHKLMFDPTTLKLEREFNTQLGQPRKKTSQIALADIHQVNFTKEGKEISTDIETKNSTYNMILNYASATNVRNLLLRSPLSPDVVGELPKM
jgi:hypothetical protein